MWRQGYQTRRGSQAPNAAWGEAEAKSVKQQIRQRRAQGDTYAEIAADLGVSINTVRNMERGLSYQDW